MDVHKKSIAIAVADTGRDQEVRFYGTIPNQLDVLDKVIRKLIFDGSELLKHLPGVSHKGLF